jgi:hypothetical protein
VGFKVGTSWEPFAPDLTLENNDQVFSRKHLAGGEVAGTAAGRLMPFALDHGSG